MTETISIRKYILIWSALLLLLLATWFFSRIDLHAFNSVIALSISILKMILIIVYFMHIRRGPRLVWVIAGAGFVWLLVLIDLTLSDYLTRGYSWSQ
jgi:cytochrome c oxidase subunit 4